MKAFTLVALLVASCTALPHGSISTQYHAQDGHEGFSYGYSDENSQKHETKVHGLTSGAYMYKDGSGHTQSVQYVADPKDGFKIVSASNLPKAPVVKEQKIEDTKAVKDAKAVHFAAIAEAEKHASDDEHYEHHHEEHNYEPVTLVKGLPVDTDAVKHAKAVHFAAIAEAAKHVSHDEYEEPSHEYVQKHEYASVTLHKGLPVDTPAVKEAKAIHFAAIAEAKAHHLHKRSAPFSYSSVAHHPSADKHAAPVHVEAAKTAEHQPKSDEHDIKYDGKYGFHIPVIKDGVPEDTHAVKNAKAEHFEAIAKAAVHEDSHHGEDDSHEYHHEEVKADDHIIYDGSLGYHVPVLTKEGVPEDTHAVKHAKAEHFEAIAKVESHPSYDHWDEKEKSVEKPHANDEHHHW